MAERISPPALHEMPAVSIVIPTFNSGRTIARALKSVLAQTYQNFEVIIADDASQDDTRQQVEQMGDARVAFLPSSANSNQGPATTRNRALARIRGDYIAFLDSDDEWLPEKLGKQVEFLDSHPACSIVVANAYDVAPDGHIIETEFDSTTPQAGPDAWRVLLKYSFIETSSVMTRAALVRRVGGFDTRLLISQDQDLWIRLALEGEVGIIDDVLGKIHQVPTGHMTRNRHRSVDIMLPMIERHVEAQAARLSKQEIDAILGVRYQTIGQDMFVLRQYGLGLKLLFKASLRQGNWLRNLFYVCHANPLGVEVKRRLRAMLSAAKSPTV